MTHLSNVTLAIIGSRDFSDYSLLESTIKAHLANFDDHGHGDGYSYDFDRIVSGGARGADSLGAKFAHEHGIYLTEFLPDWKRYGKRAGFIRNEDIIKAADIVLAFWMNNSKGTQNSLSIAKRLKKTTIIVYP